MSWRLIIVMCGVLFSAGAGAQVTFAGLMGLVNLKTYTAAAPPLKKAGFTLKDSVDTKYFRQYNFVATTAPVDVPFNDKLSLNVAGHSSSVMYTTVHRPTFSKLLSQLKDAGFASTPLKSTPGTVIYKKAGQPVIVYVKDEATQFHLTIEKH